MTAVVRTVKGFASAVIPARDEEKSIRAAIGNARASGARVVHVVVNGSTDRTAEMALVEQPPVAVHEFAEPLGLDVPRAIGAALCLASGEFLASPAGALLFLDGDMDGPIAPVLKRLVEPVLEGRLDLSLTACCSITETGPNASRVMRARLALNRRLGLAAGIGTASPSHGPFACSLRLLDCCELRDFATPPLLLVRAVLNHLSIGTGAAIRHEFLGSPYRGALHARLVADTIVGDCAEALAVLEGRPRTRDFEGAEYPGLNPYRRFDLLDSVCASILSESSAAHRTQEAGHYR